MTSLLPTDTSSFEVGINEEGTQTSPSLAVAVERDAADSSTGSDELEELPGSPSRFGDLDLGAFTPGSALLTQREIAALAGDIAESPGRASWSLSSVAQQRLEQQQRRMLLLEKENARLAQRLSLLLDQLKEGVRTSDSRKWRHKYMVEVLRRSSLERRNGHLRRQLYRMQGEYLQQTAAVTGGCDPLPLFEAWDNVSDMDVPLSPRQIHLRRLGYLALELPRNGSAWRNALGDS